MGKHQILVFHLENHKISTRGMRSSAASSQTGRSCSSSMGKPNTKWAGCTPSSPDRGIHKGTHQPGGRETNLEPQSRAASAEKGLLIAEEQSALQGRSARTPQGAATSHSR